jgi:hypothetical protein
MPQGLSLLSETSRPTLGLYGSGDSRYPDYKGGAERIFIWSDLSSGTPQSLVQDAWAQLHNKGAAPLGFIPSSGALFTDYPDQIFQVAESSDDFGSSAEAQMWMAMQSSRSAQGGGTGPAAGQQTVLTAPTDGDQGVAYQVANGPSGDVYTDMVSRFGSVVIGISIDSGPGLTGGADLQARTLLRGLTQAETSVCGMTH